MSLRKHAAAVVILCLIALTQSACARRTARTLRMPSAAGYATAHKPTRGGDGTSRVRDAIRSLKDRLHADDGKPVDAAAAEAAPVAVSLGTAAPDVKGVGTSGVSVETRYPSAAPGGTPPSQGRLLSRAGDTARRVGGAWTGAMALCLLAVALALALSLRRSRSAT